MSRIQVGEITIDGQNIHIGPRAERTPGAGLAQASNARLLTALVRLPIPTALLAWVGAGMVVAGAAVNVVVGVLSDPIAALLRGGVLAPLGAGVLGLAMLKAYVSRRSTVALAAPFDGEAERYVMRLRPLLEGPPEACTVPALARTSGWPEPTVVRVLALMRERGEVGEEVDYDTGQFYYTTLSLPPRDLDSRLGELHP